MYGFFDASKLNPLTSTVEDGILILDVTAVDRKLRFHAENLREALVRRKLPAFTAIAVRSGGVTFSHRPSQGNLDDHIRTTSNYEVARDDDVFLDVVVALAFDAQAFQTRDGGLVYDASTVSDRRLDDLWTHGAVVRHALATWQRPVTFIFNCTAIPCTPGMDLSAISQAYRAIGDAASAKHRAEKKARLEAAIGGPSDDPDLLLVITGTQDGARVYFDRATGRFGNDRFVPQFVKATFFTAETIEDDDLEGQLTSLRERFGTTVQDIHVARVGLVFERTDVAARA